MPCRNDWDPPTKAQAENRRAAKLLIALNNIHGKTSTTQLLVDSTNPVLDTDYVNVLCERMKALGELGRDKLLYSDARDPRARDLATWWEEHQARDEARMRTSPTLNLLGVCSEAMREAGKPYPRTCLVCGLGPCQRGRQLSVGVDLASGPDWTAVGAAPLVNAPATQVAGEKAIDDAMEIAERLALRLVFRNNTRTDSGYESADIAANEVRKELRAALESLAAPRQADAAYTERNHLVALLSKIYPAGKARTAIEGWSPEWHGCVYIDFPWGQASWHYHDRDAGLFNHLEPYRGSWDGHTTEAKYELIRQAVAAPQEQANMGPGRHWWPVSKGHADNVCAAAPQQAEPRDVCDVCNALTVPRNATRYDADDLKAAQVRGKIIAARLQQQAEPVAQIGWSDEFGNLFPMAAWKPAQRTHHDSHKAAWRPVFLHPPAAEVQRLRDAAGALCGALTASKLNDRAYHALNALHRALEGR